MDIKYRYIVAIDFGTSRSGFAWSHYGETDDTKDIFKKTNWPGVFNEYPKTYSDMYYDEDNEKWYYGGEARRIRYNEKNYVNNIVKINLNNYHKDYKMLLYDKKASYYDEKDIDKAKKLIQKQLGFMKKEAIDNIMSKIGVNASFTRSELEDSILWVITVPEGATDDAKVIMRQSAMDAGLIRSDTSDFSRLLFALEPEAALIAAVLGSKKIFEMQGTVVVFDAGGGTVDISVRRVENIDDSYKFRAIENVLGSCSPSGSIYMDKRFDKYLREIFGDDTVDNLITSQDSFKRNIYYDVIDKFRMYKEQTVECEEGEFEWYLNIQCLWDSLKESSKERYENLQLEISREGGISRNNVFSVFEGKDLQYLTITREWFNNVFFDVFSDAYEPLKNVMDSLQKIGEKMLPYVSLVDIHVAHFYGNILNQKLNKIFLQ